MGHYKLKLVFKKKKKTINKPTIQDALGKDKSQYPHAPLRSKSNDDAFSLLLFRSIFIFPLLLVLFVSFPLKYFLFNKSKNERKKDGKKGKLVNQPSLLPFLFSLSIQQEEDEEQEEAVCLGFSVPRRCCRCCDCLPVQRAVDALQVLAE